MFFDQKKGARLATSTHSEATLRQRCDPRLGETNVVQESGCKECLPVVFELVIRSEHRAEVICAVAVGQQISRMRGVRMLFHIFDHARVWWG